MYLDKLYSVPSFNNYFIIKINHFIILCVRSVISCTLCNNNQIGDEFHYLMEFKMFCVERKQYLGNYFCKNVNILKFETLLNSHNTRKLRIFVNF